MAFQIKRNDTRPRWRVQLKSNGAPVDLTLATNARFIMKQGSNIKINRAPMDFLDRATGIVEYTWVTGDTDSSGTYNCEVEIEWGVGEYQTFPSKGYFTVSVEVDLG